MPSSTLLGQEITLLEIMAFVAGIAGVWLTVKKSIYNFPVGLINVSLYCWLFLQDHVSLYADALLQMIYAFLLVFGWLNWKKNHEDKVLAIQITSLKEWKIIFIITLTGWLFLGSLLSSMTTASLPWLDAGLTTISLVAQWMIAKKKIENWLLWIIADAVYIPVYLYKQLPLTALLYFLFLLMAYSGWKSWKQSIQWK